MAKVIETNWRDEIVQPPKDTRVQTEVKLIYLDIIMIIIIVMNVSSSLFNIYIFYLIFKYFFLYILLGCYRN